MTTKKQATIIVPIAVALIGLAGVIISSLLTYLKGLPTPSPSVSEIIYNVRVIDNRTKLPIELAKVTIELIGGGAPLDSYSDSNGLTRIILSSEYVGKPARIIVTKDDYKSFYKNIDLLLEVLPDSIELESLTIATSTASPTVVTPTDIPTQIITPTPETIKINGEIWTSHNDEPGIYDRRTTVSRDITNFSFEADVIINDTSPEFHGLMFRAQNNNDKYFYSFRISPEGEFSFDIWEGEGAHRSIIGPLTSQYILQGQNRINHLKVIANRSNFELFINDQRVSTLSDETFLAGKLGFVSCTCSGTQESSATFSNLLVVIFP